MYRWIQWTGLIIRRIVPFHEVFPGLQRVTLNNGIILASSILYIFSKDASSKSYYRYYSFNYYRKRKVTDDHNSKSSVNSIVIDGGTVEADDNIFAKEVFIVEPHCSIEIGDLEKCDICIKRWKMVIICCIWNSKWI